MKSKIPKLDHFVNRQIYNYPILYKHENYALSRMSVLYYLFWASGSGYEWCQNGYLTCKFESSETLKVLPPDFFEQELYHLIIESNRIPELKKERINYYLRKSREKKPVHSTVFFVAQDQEQAQKIIDKFGGQIHFAIQCKNFYRPNPSIGLTDHSPLVQILKGKTIGGVEFKPQSDWLNGCIEAVNDALDYYSDKRRYEQDFFYPDNYERYLKQEKLVKKTSSVKEEAKKIWFSYRKRQIEILKKFSEIF